MRMLRRSWGLAELEVSSWDHELLWEWLTKEACRYEHLPRASVFFMAAGRLGSFRYVHDFTTTGWGLLGVRVRLTNYVLLRE
jgi:hypothetical protein